MVLEGKTAASAPDTEAQDLGILQSKEYRRALAQCIHCGLCLEACPTYAVFGTEMDGPRGRIALMRAASEGHVGIDELQATLEKHIGLCLGCRSCEAACPSGVHYGFLLDGVQQVIMARHKPGPKERFARWAGLRLAMPHRALLKFAARVLWLYEAVGLQKLVRGLHLLPRSLRSMEALLPPLRPGSPDYRKPAPALGEKRGDVAFFIGCLQDAFTPRVNEASIRVLQRNGYEVHFPQAQTCCGAAQLHNGERELAKDLARRNIDAFLKGGYAAVISNAGGCGATLRDEYAGLLQDDPAYGEKAKQFQSRVMDINEFLAAHLNNPPRGPVPARVTYVDSCHLRHVQKVAAQPRALLRGIPGLELVELKMPDRCCGSAGTYNVVHPQVADQVLAAKMADVGGTGAQMIIASNIGCQLQLIAGARRTGLKAPVLHVVELLELSYQTTERQEQDAG
jgi:glycolate oxidase iron-sulfur subunit